MAMSLWSPRCHASNAFRSTPGVRRVRAPVNLFHSHRPTLPPSQFASVLSRPRAAARLRLRSVAFEEAAVVPVYVKGELSEFPEKPAVYAVYDDKDQLQYIGVSRRLSATIAGHLQDQKDYTNAIKYTLVEDSSREALTDAWKVWVEAAVAATQTVPPGNAPGDSIWKRKAKPAKPELKLTAGKGITGITIEGLIKNLVNDVKVVAFIKGKRLQPQCGFSYKMLNILNDTGIEYEVVDVLDEFHNPGLREAIKGYSQWPTIPQLYVNSEFVGGADIVEQMAQSGELLSVLTAEKAASTS